MELKVNLADREDVAAAHALLAVILDNTYGVRQEPSEAHLVPPAPAAPAPSSAGAAPLPNAPVAMPVPSSPALSVPPPPAPPPAPVAVAPSAPAALTTPAPGVEVDARGLPWDERIHASTKTKLTDGTWKAKRGINDPALVKRVEDELRAAMAAQPLPEVTAAGFGQAPLPPGVTPAPFVPPAASSVPAPPAAPSASAAPTTFEQLMPRVSRAAAAGTLPPTALNETCQAQGLSSVLALQTAPQFIPQVWAALVQKYPALEG